MVDDQGHRRRLGRLHRRVDDDVHVGDVLEEADHVLERGVRELDVHLLLELLLDGRAPGLVLLVQTARRRGAPRIELSPVGAILDDLQLRQHGGADLLTEQLVLLVPAVRGHLPQVDVALAPALRQERTGTHLGTVDLQHLVAEQDRLIEVTALAGALGAHQHGVDAVTFDLQAQVAQLLLAALGGAVALARGLEVRLLAARLRQLAQRVDAAHLGSLALVGEGQRVEADRRHLEVALRLVVVARLHGALAVLDLGLGLDPELLLLDIELVADAVDGHRARVRVDAGHGLQVEVRLLVGTVVRLEPDRLGYQPQRVGQAALILGLHGLDVEAVGGLLVLGAVRREGSLVAAGVSRRRRVVLGPCHRAQGEHGQGESRSMAGGHCVASSSSYVMIETVAKR